MLHVKEIREIIESGQGDEAHAALDQLLAIGPNNIEALKLRALLHEQEGRFAEEAKIWDKIAVVDHEDPDAVAYLLHKQIEDREHFYFTDDVPGGRRFLAYPRALVNYSVVGLLGCVAFLLMSRLSLRFTVLAQPPAMLGLFGFFVMLPWFGIITVYLRCIRSITLTVQGIAVATRLKTRSFLWGDLEKVCLARSNSGKRPHLSLVLLPRDKNANAVEIDLYQGSTSVRARSYLIREITRLFSEPEYTRREILNLDQRKTATY